MINDFTLPSQTEENANSYVQVSGISDTQIDSDRICHLFPRMNWIEVPTYYMHFSTLNFIFNNQRNNEMCMQILLVFQTN